MWELPPSGSTSCNRGLAEAALPWKADGCEGRPVRAIRPTFAYVFYETGSAIRLGDRHYAGLHGGQLQREQF